MYVCSECEKMLNPFDIRYHTADMVNLFCDAYCSFEWHVKNNMIGEKNGEEK